MKVTNVLALFLGGMRLAAAWDVDPRCPPPPAPAKRALGDAQDEDALTSDRFVTDDMELFDTTPTSALRRNSVIASENTLRSLESVPVFSLKMHWEEGYCWQEEYSRERKWCWECKDGCKEGGTLWWQKCVDSKDQKFNYLPDPQGGRFKTAYYDLCLHSVSVTQYVLQKCSTNKAQVIVGYQAGAQPFELSPLADSSHCINQDHHPKAGEIVENTTCKLSRKWHTNFMEFYNLGSDNGLDIDNQIRLRADDCSTSNPCDRCQGDCDEDDHCRGSGLVCFQRIGSTKDSPVPGCTGVAITDKDYCVSKDLVVLPSPTSSPVRSKSPVRLISPVLSVALNTKVRACSAAKPCGQCEGDCDVDADCKAGLKCFLKDGPLDIPGCVGRDVSKNDFCFLP